MSARSETLELLRPQAHTLREYALLADGERGILVGPRGEFAWMCFPTWDADALVSSLLGGAGAYTITPEGRFVWSGYYETGTLIWRSTWTTEESTVQCREALVLPSQPDRAVVVRRVIALQGRARVRIALDLRAGFGAQAMRGLREESGEWIGRAGDAYFRWTGSATARPQRDGHGGRALVMTLELEEGTHHDLVLVLDCNKDAADPPDPEHALHRTEAEWHERVPPLEETVAAHDARHAYAVLSGLTSKGGGMVAAATTSLPELSRRGRNFDYRYVWIRDQCYAGLAVAKAGPYPLLDDSVRFVRERLLADGPNLKPAYTTTGGNVPDERELDLPGYPGGANIVGNWVNKQFQLDVFGEALLLFSAAAGHGHLDEEGWRAAEIAADAIAGRWEERDAGIWEIEPAEWTHSRLICAAGLRAIAEQQGAAGDRATRWVALADRIVADTASRAVHSSGRWQRSPDDPGLDAALLLPAIRGAIPATDPRSVATLQAIDQELTQDGYVYRSRLEDRPLGEGEGAFLLCGFWLSLAWSQQGDGFAAARWFERSRAACGPPGLFAEEFDVQQRQLQGNLPQAFVHALLLECAVELTNAWQG